MCFEYDARRAVLHVKNNVCVFMCLPAGALLVVKLRALLVPAFVNNFSCCRVRGAGE